MGDAPEVLPQEKGGRTRLVFLQRAASVAKNTTAKQDLTFVRVILLKQVPSEFQEADHWGEKKGGEEGRGRGMTIQRDGE